MLTRKIAIITATSAELSPLLQDFHLPDVDFVKFSTGVGMVNMALNCQNFIHQHQPTACILIGIAGTFTSNLPLQSVVAVKEESYGDMGVMENNQWMDLYDLNLANPNETPFSHKKLINPYIDQIYLRLPTVTSTTVNTITTDPNTIQRFKTKELVQIESMEGAAFHQVMLQNNIPFLQLRAISNEVGIRDKKQWSIGPAIHAVNQTCIDLLNNGLFNDLS